MVTISAIKYNHGALIEYAKYKDCRGYEFITNYHGDLYSLEYSIKERKIDVDDLKSKELIYLLDELDDSSGIRIISEDDKEFFRMCKKHLNQDLIDFPQLGKYIENETPNIINIDKLIITEIEFYDTDFSILFNKVGTI